MGQKVCADDVKIRLREKNVEKLRHEMLAKLDVSCLANRAHHTRSSAEALAKWPLINTNVVDGKYLRKYLPCQRRSESFISDPT